MHEYYENMGVLNLRSWGLKWFNDGSQMAMSCCQEICTCTSDDVAAENEKPIIL